MLVTRSRETVRTPLLGLARWSALRLRDGLAMGNNGLGFLITIGRRFARPDMIVLGMVMVGLTGFIVSLIIDRIEKRLLAGIRS